MNGTGYEFGKDAVARELFSSLKTNYNKLAKLSGLSIYQRKIGICWKGKLLDIICRGGM